MNVRGLVRELLVSYMNERNVRFVPIREFAGEYRNAVPKTVDLYRMAYHIGLNDEGFSIEKDEETTYVRIL